MSNNYDIALFQNTVFNEFFHSEECNFALGLVLRLEIVHVLQNHSCTFCAMTKIIVDEMNFAFFFLQLNTMNLKMTLSKIFFNM